MDPEELCQKLEKIRELEKTFKGSSESSRDEKLVGQYSHLLSSMPDLFSYTDLRDYHNHLVSESRANDEGEFKRRLLKSLKGQTSPEAYSILESEIEGLLP